MSDPIDFPSSDAAMEFDQDQDPEQSMLDAPAQQSLVFPGTPSNNRSQSRTQSQLQSGQNPLFMAGTPSVAGTPTRAGNRGTRDLNKTPTGQRIQRTPLFQGGWNIHLSPISYGCQHGVAEIMWKRRVAVRTLADLTSHRLVSHQLW
jgi:hypothetical protein